MKKDYRGKTNWKTEDPFFQASDGTASLNPQKKLIAGIVLAIIIIAIIAGALIWTNHKHQQNVVAPPVAPPVPQTITIPLQIPTHS